MKRELGNGRWDKILVKRMTALSVADNYEEAKEEWIATGDVWWRGSADMPEWVSTSSHPNYCLCGHPIVYHFRIQNTENGVEEIVGSDHINSYLIMRQIAEEMKVDLQTVSDEQVERWLKERVGSMKAEAWWAENGLSFTTMFDAVKEIDLWHNVHEKNVAYDTKYRRYETQKVLRKKGKGQFGIDYDMASIVWRWNHPDNPKAQIKTRGYPNDKLMMDLSLFFAQSVSMRPAFEAWKQERKDRLVFLEEKKRQEERRKQERLERQRLAQIEWEKGAPERERLAKKRKMEQMLEAKRRDERQLQKALKDLALAPSESFKNMCDFYGFPVFDDSFPSNLWEARFLVSIREKLNKRGELTTAQFVSMKDIMLEKPPTDKQVKYLRDLGWEGEIPSKQFASTKIGEILENKGE
jgi:hypothetical protein